MSSLKRSQSTQLRHSHNSAGKLVHVHWGIWRLWKWNSSPWLRNESSRGCSGSSVGLWVERWDADRVLCVCTRSGNKFKVNYWEIKNKCKHSSHRTAITFQAKQTLNLGREKLANIPSSSKEEKGMFQTLFCLVGFCFLFCFALFILVHCFLSNHPIKLQAFCETTQETTSVVLCKSSNIMSFPFLSFSLALSSLSSEPFPESDSSLQIWRWDFFLREDSFRPLGSSSSRNLAMEEQNPRRNMKFIFKLKLWFMRNSWADYARFHLNRFEGHSDLVDLYMLTLFWDLYITYVSTRLLFLLSQCLVLHMITMCFQHLAYTFFFFVRKPLWELRDGEMKWTNCAFPGKL